MSKKSGRIAERIEGLRDGDLDPHYLGYFDCFNRGEYYEAHDVLEELWLVCRKGPDDHFYKGLIQFAGAFVHLQKGRLGPAAALFRLADKHLSGYPAAHHRLDVTGLLGQLRLWLGRLEGAEFALNPLGQNPPPELGLLPDSGARLAAGSPEFGKAP